MYKLNNIDKIIYNVKKALILNDNLCKLLYFDGENALSQSITEEQKDELFDKNSENSKNRVLNKIFNPEIITDVRSELRFFNGVFEPDNDHLAIVQLHFQVIVHNDLWDLEWGLIRAEQMVKEILLSLNGEKVEGIGVLDFDAPIKLQTFGDKFTGYKMIGITRVT